MDPKTFDREIIDGKSLYKLSKKSDVYIGVLFWELTSCSSPFNFETKMNSSKQALMSAILEGKRETPIPNTNDKFVKLYQSK